MGGTKSGGLRAAQINKTKYGENYYRDIGREGGKNGHTGGFYGRPDLASKMGKLGGRPRKPVHEPRDMWPELEIPHQDVTGDYKKEPPKKKWWRRIWHS